ncbi:GNAT family N-acetyltransferase [Nocardiopsis composta]|uniref:Ribosomal protein S18 acetylase RimI-like enzyme n=1 Tax=Nocardiopsis composta TaxID=157465 RepID=A0A7W8QJB5_9ACTN|nr:GNAT family N-acetyltransferase [Nocardiopsis composta]MBB5431527.1 ribosomal protein S18 acetylase RimI-like enzyme [Nocardiopsis composta]
MSTRSFGVRIRPAVPEDAEEIERIRIAGWRTAYRGILPDAVLDSLVPRAARHAERIRDPRGTGDAVALLDGRPAGWIAYGPARDDDVPTGTAEIYGCYVDPAAQRLGVGRLLMAEALGVLGDRAPVVLWVLRENTPARRFYRRVGFAPDGRECRLETDLLPADAEVFEVRYRRGAGPA